MRWLIVLSLVVAACSGPGQEAIVIDTTAPGAATGVAGPTPATATGGSTTTTQPAPDTTTVTGVSSDPLLGLAYEEVAANLGFPVFVDAPTDDPRLFIVSKDGYIWVWRSGAILEDPFLDISDLVRDEGEQGLLGLAFDPSFADTGRFFVHYSDARGDTVLASYHVSADPDRADPASGEILFEADQPASNHNGGMLTFGPGGFLYLALGDGGRSNDAFGNGQRSDTVFGAILRFEVDPFGPAPGNQFDEVWSYGLRNPWRFSFDTDLIYIADVGQNTYEEIDVAPASRQGLNFGWPLTEGLHCFAPPSGCDVDGLTLPVLEVTHGDGGACSITGGYVYRGSEIPELTGHYFYSDYCGGWLRSFVWDGSAVTQPTDWTDDLGTLGAVTSFGTDAFGELYVTAGKSVYKIVPVR
ncbi:MAG: PQQ-dependent sugar dehydrogenase [Acidimicrobiia bacterium]|nr:PQQ-dependent sugar dehydrogenase [Acidimicrobiia bacterium]